MCIKKNFYFFIKIGFLFRRVFVRNWLFLLGLYLVVIRVLGFCGNFCFWRMIVIKGVCFLGIVRVESIVLFWIVVLGVLLLRLFFRL